MMVSYCWCGSKKLLYTSRNTHKNMSHRWQDRQLIFGHFGGAKKEKPQKQCYHKKLIR